MKSWFKRYWPWLVALFFLGVYELIALFAPPNTLSAMVWAADAAFPALRWIILAAFVVLFWHFFYQRRKR